MTVVNPIPVWVFLIALSVLTILSFGPQLFRIWSRRDASGISLFYVLCNLISATQQVMFGGIYVLTAHQDIFAWTWPVSVLDWINLAQLVVVWASMLLLFITCLATGPPAPGLKSFVVLIYIFVLFLTLIPLVVLLFDPDERNGVGKGYSGLGHIVLLFTHIRFIVPIVTFIAAAALYPQARAIRSQPPGESTSLSLTGLLFQAVIFAVVALSWVFRVKWKDAGVPAAEHFGWYRMVGWATVNNAIFAAVQIILFFLARRRMTAPRATDGETEPLLTRD